MSPIRVVFDTNVLLVSLSTRSPYHWVLRAVADGRAVLCVTTAIALEYEEVVARRMGRAAADVLATFLDGSPSVEWIHTRYRWRLIPSDPDDDKFVDCAVAAAATVVSEDRHFDAAREVAFPPLRVVGVDGFRSLLDEVTR